MIIKDFKLRDGKWAGSCLIEGRQHRTKAYQVWSSMMQRCESNGYVKTAYATYKDAQVSGEFKDFQSFADWCTSQPGYGMDDYQLDKDIITRNNKIYSSETCCFVPRKLNMMFCAANNTKSIHPKGVSTTKNRKFRACISIDHKNHHLGTFNTANDAAKAYNKMKASQCRDWLTKFLNGAVVVDDRVITAIEDWVKYYEQQS